MLKKATLLLLLVLLVNSTALLKANNSLPNSFSSIPITSNCTPIDSSMLSVNNQSDTYVYVYSPSSIEGKYSQFRYRPIGTSLWLFSSIRLTYYRLLRNLQPGTLYEFQVSYKCTETVWSEFSKSSTFKTSGLSMPITIEVEEMDTADIDTIAIDSMTLDSMLLDIIDNDTIETESMDSMDVVHIDTIAIDTIKIDTMPISIMDKDSLSTDTVAIEQVDTLNPSTQIAIKDAVLACGVLILSQVSNLQSLGIRLH